GVEPIAQQIGDSLARAIDSRALVNLRQPRGHGRLRFPLGLEGFAALAPLARDGVDTQVYHHLITHTMRPLMLPNASSCHLCFFSSVTYRSSASAAGVTGSAVIDLPIPLHSNITFVPIPRLSTISSTRLLHRLGTLSPLCREGSKTVHVPRS